jgi:hypothetical protein
MRCANAAAVFCPMTLLLKSVQLATISSRRRGRRPIPGPPPSRGQQDSALLRRRCSPAIRCANAAAVFRPMTLLEKHICKQAMTRDQLEIRPSRSARAQADAWNTITIIFDRSDSVPPKSQISLLTSVFSCSNFCSRLTRSSEIKVFKAF